MMAQVLGGVKQPQRGVEVIDYGKALYLGDGVIETVELKRVRQPSADLSECIVVEPGGIRHMVPTGPSSVVVGGITEAEAVARVADWMRLAAAGTHTVHDHVRPSQVSLVDRAARVQVLGECACGGLVIENRDQVVAAVGDSINVKVTSEVACTSCPDWQPKI